MTSPREASQKGEKTSELLPLLIPQDLQGPQGNWSFSVPRTGPHTAWCLCSSYVKDGASCYTAHSLGLLRWNLDRWYLHLKSCYAALFRGKSARKGDVKILFKVWTLTGFCGYRTLSNKEG